MACILWWWVPFFTPNPCVRFFNLSKPEDTPVCDPGCQWASGLLFSLEEEMQLLWLLQPLVPVFTLFISVFSNLQVYISWILKYFYFNFLSFISYILLSSFPPSLSNSIRSVVRNHSLTDLVPLGVLQSWCPALPTYLLMCLCRKQLSLNLRLWR